ncbi:unnamed protein product [Candida verbasci]|uniref:Uncharacterized protein n=1 Tax=Candida verbasci TaxID=1227364 RepID=A0A9W4TU81_9ASCO|nr:unnamed protein product [Candida verbasci]
MNRSRSISPIRNKSPVRLNNSPSRLVKLKTPSLIPNVPVRSGSPERRLKIDQMEQDRKRLLTEDNNSLLDKKKSKLVKFDDTIESNTEESENTLGLILDTLKNIQSKLDNLNNRMKLIEEKLEKR